MLKIITITYDGQPATGRCEYWLHDKLQVMVTAWHVADAETKIRQMLVNLGYDPGEVIYEQQQQPEFFSG